MNFIDCTKFFGENPGFEIGFGAYGDNDFHLMMDYGSGMADPVNRDFGTFSYESVAEIKVLWEEQDLLWDDDSREDDFDKMMELVEEWYRGHQMEEDFYHDVANYPEMRLDPLRGIR